MSTTPEAYVHLSEDQTTLTFYYDSLRADRDGTTWGIRDTKKGHFCTIPAWTGDGESPDTSVLTAVFDASVRDFALPIRHDGFTTSNHLKVSKVLNTSTPLR